MTDTNENRRDLTGAIRYAEPERYAKVVDWCAGWVARLQREGLLQEKEGESE